MDKKHLGINIGKKNLSFCFATKTHDGKLLNINEWNKINLIDESLVTCSGHYKNNKACTAKPSFFHVDDNGIKTYYCKTHKSQHIIKDDLIMVKVDNKEKEKCCHLSNKNVKCIKNGVCKVADELLCKVHGEQFINGDKKKNVLQPFKKTNASDVDPLTLCTRIFENFGKYEIFKTLDEVRIENQPALINAEMKAVASMVFSYFVHLNIVYGLKIKIYYVSAVKKMQYTEPFIKFMDGKVLEHGKSKKDNCKCDICKMNIMLGDNKVKFENEFNKYYFDHDNVKQVSIFWAEFTLIELGLGHLFKMIDAHKKKDDDCDAFVYAMKDEKK